MQVAVQVEIRRSRVTSSVQHRIKIFLLLSNLLCKQVLLFVLVFNCLQTLLKLILNLVLCQKRSVIRVSIFLCNLGCFRRLDELVLDNLNSSRIDIVTESLSLCGNQNWSSFYSIIFLFQFVA